MTFQEWLETKATWEEFLGWAKAIQAFFRAQGESIVLPEHPRLTRSDVDAMVIAQGEASAKAEFIKYLSGIATGLLGKGLFL